MPETNNSNQIPNGRRQTSGLFTSMTEDLNSWLPWANPAGGQSGTWTRSLRTASPALKPIGHVASLNGAYCLSPLSEKTRKSSDRWGSTMKTVPDCQTNFPCHNQWKSMNNSVKKIHTDIKGNKEKGDSWSVKAMGILGRTPQVRCIWLSSP